MFEPTYSLPFLTLMADTAYETLRAYLAAKHSKVAVELLDSIILLLNLQGRETVTAIDEQMAAETFALVSKQMEKLGFQFTSKQIK